jgi:hypothetical protein
MAFYDYISIRGINSDYPSAQIVQGLGGNTNGAAGSAENPINMAVTINPNELEAIREAIESLQYNNDVVELPGNIRLNLCGRVLAY